MKPKTISKKMILNKRSVANLSMYEKGMAKGGNSYPTHCGCPAYTMYGDTCWDTCTKPAPSMLCCDTNYLSC
jgi:hypothetical protein